MSFFFLSNASVLSASGHGFPLATRLRNPDGNCQIMKIRVLTESVFDPKLLTNKSVLAVLERKLFSRTQKKFFKTAKFSRLVFKLPLKTVYNTFF